MVTLPRVVVAAPGSGQGKTSVATGLLGALRGAGLEVSPHKVGPDYIDPGYHGLAAGRPGRNLDPFLVGTGRIRELFVHGATTPRTADVAVVEGVMGLFDGASTPLEGVRDFASTAHVARLLEAPVVLVVDASGMARSAAAVVHGFTTFDPALRLGGVICNRVGSPAHEALLRDAMVPLGIPVLGCVPRRPSLSVPSRHLGLVPAAERSAAALDVVAELAETVRGHVDLEAVVRIARTAPPLDIDAAPVELPRPDVRVAVASGAAFTFGYAEQPELLRARGAEVVPFDPLTDEDLPSDVAGIVIGGGFPEEHAADLAANAPLRARIASMARAGVPVAAECAGLLYLGRTLDDHEMCGVLDVDTAMTGRLTLGYREAVAASGSVLADAGTPVRGHEFHRTAVVRSGETDAAWTWTTRTADVTEGVARRNVHASYLHLNWAGRPEIADRFLAACRHRVRVTA
ncbi:cobyrinate/hydrogenobyrinate a,c-diamide synthase [Jatrophihabitans fulvus]